MNCYRVLVKDANGQSWWPVIIARDPEHVAHKVGYIYPDAEVIETIVLHDALVVHKRWGATMRDEAVSPSGFPGTVS